LEHPANRPFLAMGNLAKAQALLTQSEDAQFGRPVLGAAEGLPFARALARPARTRSTIISRSNLRRSRSRDKRGGPSPSLYQCSGCSRYIDPER
jgi:hypothetical protein